MFFQVLPNFELSDIEKTRLKNIKENEEVLKSLGLPTARRKFARHVPNVAKAKLVESSDEESSSEGENDAPDNNADLVSGEIVYLMNNDSEVFKAKYEETEVGTEVHGRTLKEGEGRFFITKVMRNAVNKWTDFDPDTMCVGAPILWQKDKTKRSGPVTVSAMGTEAKNATPLETRKRKRKPELWKKNKRKTAVNHGYEFEDKRKKLDGSIVTKNVKKREMKPPCKESCRFKCREKFNEEARQKAFDDFYANGDRAIQSQQIASLVTQEKKARTRTKDADKESRRDFSRTYSLVLNGESINVCQTMFLNTLGVSEKRVRTEIQNVTITGAPKPDARGRHGKHRTAEQRERFVMENIQQFKVLESHYVRKEAKYEYLPSELNITEMYRLYIQWLADKPHYPKEEYTFYARVFRERFNLKFQKPKKDECDTCESFRNADSPTEEMQAAQEGHLRDKESARQIKEKAKIKWPQHFICKKCF